MSTDICETADAGGWGVPRSRTFTWFDPAAITAEGLSMAGLDYLLAMKSGELPPPPSASLVGMDIVSAELGRVVVAWEPDESMYNATGVIHGGIVGTVLDTVAGCAILSSLPKGKGQASLEIKVSYLKAVRADSGRLTATGTVTKVGSRIGFADGVVTDAGGAMIATATSTFLIVDN
jgi:uncharacterized protein (TIGR00369 family)